MLSTKGCSGGPPFLRNDLQQVCKDTSLLLLSLLLLLLLSMAQPTEYVGMRAILPPLIV